MTLLDDTLAAIRPASADALAAAEARQLTLTKPAGTGKNVDYRNLHISELRVRKMRPDDLSPRIA